MNDGIKRKNYTQEEALKYLGITLSRLKELEDDSSLPTEYIRTIPHPREPGKLLEQNPENEKFYTAETVENLKRRLDAEMEEKNAGKSNS